MTNSNNNTPEVKIKSGNRAVDAFKTGSMTAVIGAAFLMATSSIGPGFLNNTVIYTKEFMGALLFIIVICVALDIVTHQNIWRTVCYVGKRGPDVANTLQPGLGHLIVVLMVVSGFTANMGNIGGVALSLEVLFNFTGAPSIVVGGFIGLIIFLQKDIKAAMDKSTTFLGALMLVLCLYVMMSSAPPVERISSDLSGVKMSDMIMPIIALVGGTAGAYLSLAGPHRLIDAGITGPENVGLVKKSALLGSCVGASMRVLLFLTGFGVLAAGNVTYDPASPAASVFRAGSGQIGYILFGIILFAAAATSVVGASYTCISILKTAHPIFIKQEKMCIVVWIIVSTLLMAFFGAPAKIMLFAGAISGLILPVVLSIILLASRSKRIMGEDYHHPKYLTALGWLVVIMTGYAACMALPRLASIFN